MSECVYLKLTPQYDACTTGDDDGVMCQGLGRTAAHRCYRFQHACRESAERVVGLLVEAGRSAQDCLTYHGLSGKARPQVMSPAFGTNVYRALEDALAAAAALGLETGAEE